MIYKRLDNIKSISLPLSPWERGLGGEAGYLKLLMKEKNIIFGARMMSILFTPFYLPIVGLIALFTFSYMSQLPWDYKLEVLLLVYIATIFVPTVLIHLYRRYQGWSLIELGHKERRMVPYIISILCYFWLLLSHDGVTDTAFHG